MKTSFRGHDLRTESICLNCQKFGDCKYAREGKTICNHFIKSDDDY